ncbi:hypothetical protein [Paraburkholderia sp. GAS42]|jgi:hypothetical protein|uniref:hypothetical protein n=1 Tax=Paraburkholderia sp. GAS42 TaxID=3035135 RepID=UPI003D20A789
MSPRRISRLSLRASLVACALSGAAAFGGFLPETAHAQSVPRVTADATIANGAATGVHGAIAMNETAGLDNVQANQLTITTGGAVANDNASAQSSTVAAKVKAARASIEGNAFSSTSGAVMLNQSAGAGNLQQNSVQLGTAALGVETVADGVLSAAAAKNGGSGQSIGVQSVREANISGEAFKNVSGIVQINQTAGAGNATANSFVLRPPAGTLF